MTTRETIFQALFGLVSQGEGMPGTVTWAGSGVTQFSYTSRRFQLWAELPSMPALIQSEGGEDFARTSSTRAKRTFSATWVVLHNLGLGASAAPTSLNNNIVDALEAALLPAPTDPGYPARQTLGGLVSHAWIEGHILKIPGDLDNQALISVPIKILVP